MAKEKEPKIIRIIRKVENTLTIIGAFMLLALMLIGTADVVGRYIFNHPITGAMEYGRMLMAGVILFYWAYAQATKGHISIEILVNTFPPRARAITDFVILLGSLGLFGIITWQATVIAIEDWEVHRVFAITNIPLTFPRLLVSFGAFVICLEFILQLIRLFPGVLGKGGDRAVSR